MFPAILVVSSDEGAKRFRAFTITIYCESENFEHVCETATHAAANVDGVIMADCSPTGRVPNGWELDTLEEIVDS